MDTINQEPNIISDIETPREAEQNQLFEQRREQLVPADSTNRGSIVLEKQGEQIWKSPDVPEIAPTSVRVQEEQELKPAEIAERFAAVAAAPGVSYGVPEQLLAGYIDEQIRAGNHNINLTQSYLTESPDEADARHTLALSKLLPLIEAAQMSGITFEAGEAQLAGEKLREIIAIRNVEAAGNRFSVGG
jgi:hypothetical protein